MPTPCKIHPLCILHFEKLVRQIIEELARGLEVLFSAQAQIGIRWVVNSRVDKFRSEPEGFTQSHLPLKRQFLTKVAEAPGHTIKSTVAMRGGWQFG